MNRIVIAAILLSTCICHLARGDRTVVLSGEKKRNNLVSELLDVAAIPKSDDAFAFTRSGEGWILISAACQGQGKVTIRLESASAGKPVVLYAADSTLEKPSFAEVVRRVAKGEHKIRVDCEGSVVVDKLVVKAIPEL